MRVLIATEGSEFSNAAVRTFCRMFGSCGNVQVKVISVVQPALIPAAPFAVSPEFVAQIDDLAKSHARDIVQSAAGRIRDEMPGSAAVTSEVLMGTPGEVIIKEAANWNADLVVTGSHGHGFLKRAWLGSVSDAVVHHVPCSVLIIRKDGTPRY